MKQPMVQRHGSGNEPVRCESRPSHAYRPWRVPLTCRIGRVRAKREELGTLESCSSEQAWRWSGKHRRKPGRRLAVASVVCNRYVGEPGHENENVRGGACIAEADAAGGGAAIEQRCGTDADDVGVAAVCVLAGSSAVVFVAGVDAGADVHAGVSVDVVGVAAAGNATRPTLGAQPWLSVADRGRQCVSV